MLQRKPGTRLGEAVDVVRQAQLVELGQPRRIAGQNAEAQPGQTLLGQGTHYQQVVVTPKPIHKTLLGEGVIGLVQHHQAGRLAQ